jgi:hypothetical protein
VCLGFLQRVRTPVRPAIFPRGSARDACDVTKPTVPKPSDAPGTPSIAIPNLLVPTFNAAALNRRRDRKWASHCEPKRERPRCGRRLLFPLRVQLSVRSRLPAAGRGRSSPPGWPGRPRRLSCRSCARVGWRWETSRLGCCTEGALLARSEQAVVHASTGRRTNRARRWVGLLRTVGTAPKRA